MIACQKYVPRYLYCSINRIKFTNIGPVSSKQCTVNVLPFGFTISTREAIWHQFQEQANEREQERDEFNREVQKLKKALSDQEKKQAAENRLQREVGLHRTGQ